MDWKKIKFMLSLYWVRIAIVSAIVILLIATIVIISTGIRAWNEAESYLRQSQLAMMPLQMFMWLVMGLVQAVVFTYMYYWLFFKRGMSSFSRTQKKSIAGEEIGIGWNDVIGMDEAKQEALEVVNLIKDRAELKRIGGKILRGILMMGPPGCGKTYLAKAIATEAKLPFLSISGSEFTEMFVGVGAGRVRSLFKKARQLAEFEGGCIIFMDELDAVGAQRAADPGFGGQTERNTTVNQLLVEMDGLKEKDDNVVLIGATNAPEWFLDQALLRPGRFDRKIYVDYPNLDEREKLFDYYLKGVKYEPGMDCKRLAKLTVGNTPADIANLVREAALIAIRNKKEAIGMKEISEAYDRVEMGIKHKVVFTEKERRKIAYHEAGHAITMYLLAPHVDVFKATILSRKGALGFVLPHEREELHVKIKEQYLAEIKYCLGSYAAEKIKVGTTSSGVSMDFTNAMQTAYNMVWKWGMGSSGYLGNYSMLEGMREDYGIFRGQEKSYLSDNQKDMLNADVKQILDSCLKEVTELLNKESALLDRFAQELLVKDELNYDEIEAIFKEFGKTRPPA